MVLLLFEVNICLVYNNCKIKVWCLWVLYVVSVCLVVSKFVCDIYDLFVKYEFDLCCYFGFFNGILNVMISYES